MSCICDFCSHEPVLWRYPASDFIAYVAGPIVGESMGDWAACAACYDLIEQGDRAGLAERSLASLIGGRQDLQAVRNDLVREITSLHSLFFDLRKGAAIRYAPQPVEQI